MVDTMDSQLLSDFAKGDGPAFEELVKRHQGMVLGVCRRVTDDAEYAEDAAQATFLLLANNARKLRSHPSIAGWLHRTATNVARTALRSANRRRHWEAKAMAENEIGEDTAHEHKELFLSVLDDAMTRLPAQDRECLVLHYVEGLSPAEVGERLDVKSSTLSMRLSRARERLRKSLRKLGLPLTGGAVVALLGAPLSASASTTFATVVTGAACQLQAASLVGLTGVSPTVMSLTQGVMKTMFLKKLALASIATLTLGTAALALAKERPKEETPKQLAVVKPTPVEETTTPKGENESKPTPVVDRNLAKKGSALKILAVRDTSAQKRNDKKAVALLIKSQREFAKLLPGVKVPKFRLDFTKHMVIYLQNTHKGSRPFTAGVKTIKEKIDASTNVGDGYLVEWRLLEVLQGIAPPTPSERQAAALIVVERTDDSVSFNYVGYERPKATNGLYPPAMPPSRRNGRPIAP